MLFLKSVGGGLFLRKYHQKGPSEEYLIGHEDDLMEDIIKKVEEVLGMPLSSRSRRKLQKRKELRR